VLAAGSRLGPYEIVAPLGAGGMGEVYRARDLRLGREVAVKVLPELSSKDPLRLERFEREARAVAALSHPNILAIHDYGSQGGVTYAVMELLEGETLRSRLARGALPWRDAVEIGAAIAEGLAAAHAKGIVHRDLKPENLFLTAAGQVKILDFGLARITPIPDSQSVTDPYIPAETDSGTVLGTVGYMSPEQVRGQPADIRSDIFSFGCVLYEMVTGRRAFQHETAAETMTAILKDEPPDPTRSGEQIPVELARMIRQCLAKKPNQRFQSPLDLALGLRAAASEALPHSPVDRRPSRLLAGVLATLVVAALISTLVYVLTRDGRSPKPGAPAEEVIGVEALAVLPFENVGGDPSTEYLSDGLADHLINSLSHVRSRDLAVRPFTSVASYKGQRIDARTVSRELGVQMLITGRLYQQGETLSITVALVDARDDNQLWGGQYQGQRTDILAMQEDVAKDIAINLGLHLTDEEEKRLTIRSTHDPEAYLLYREGRYHWNKFTEAGLRTSIEYFTRALKQDPNYAVAYAGLADAYQVLGTNFWPPREAFPQAKENLLKALAIDNTSAAVHHSLGSVLLFYDREWAAAEKELNLALQIDPRLADAHHVKGFCLAATGRIKEAVSSFERAGALNPGPPIEFSDLCNAHIWARQYAQAIVAGQHALEIDPNFSFAYQVLGIAYTHQGKYAEAGVALRKALEFDKEEPQNLGPLGYLLAVSGKAADARQVLAQLKALQDRRYVAPYLIAYVHAGLGEKAEAFLWLRKSFENRDPWLVFLKVDPFWECLRSDARFTELVQDMGLPL
jgi:serine/threonine-protein kinase